VNDLLGMVRAKELINQALAISTWRAVTAAGTLGVVGDITHAQELANALDHDSPRHTLIQNRDLPTIRVLILIHDQRPQEAIKILQTAKAYRRGGAGDGVGLMRSTFAGRRTSVRETRPKPQSNFKEFWTSVAGLATLLSVFSLTSSLAERR